MPLTSLVRCGVKRDKELQGLVDDAREVLKWVERNASQTEAATMRLFFYAFGDMRSEVTRLEAELAEVQAQLKEAKTVPINTFPCGSDP